MQENEAKPHNYQTDIEELKDAGANQVRNELVAYTKESNKSLTDAISANTSAVVNLTKSIKGEQKKEDDSAEGVLEELANEPSSKSNIAERTYEKIKENKEEFNPFSASSLFSTWGSGSSTKESRKNADVLVESYYKHPKTKEEVEYKGTIRKLLSGIWGTVKGVVKGIGYLSTFIANSIFHPIETAKWIASKLAPLLAKLAPVAATAVGLGAVIGLGTEVLTTRSQRERFLKSRGAELSDNGSWDVSKMSEYDMEIARDLLDKEGKLKGADEIGWGTVFKLAFANLSDSIKAGLSGFFPKMIDIITKEIPRWGKIFGETVVDVVKPMLRSVLHEFGDYVVDGIAEVTPGMESKAEYRKKVNSELLEHSMGDVLNDDRHKIWFAPWIDSYWAFMGEENQMIARHQSDKGKKEGFSEKFLDRFANTAFEMSALEKRLPQDLWGYISPNKVNEDGKHLSAFELFKETPEFKLWKSNALKADETKGGEVDITSEERSELSELFIKFFEQAIKDETLVDYKIVADKKSTDVESEKASQAKPPAQSVQQNSQPPQNNITNNNFVQHTDISYSTNHLFDAAWRAVLQ